jgi:chromosome segregation ATPase
VKKKVKEELNQKVKQIKLLENERQDNIDKLLKREKDLYKYKFKIKDLKKSKHVLTHRTIEMKASLQPKEAQIEAATEKFNELKDSIEQKIEEVNECGIELTKMQSKINQYQYDLLQ